MDGSVAGRWAVGCVVVVYDGLWVVGAGCVAVLYVSALCGSFVMGALVMCCRVGCSVLSFSVIGALVIVLSDVLSGSGALVIGALVIRCSGIRSLCYALSRDLPPCLSRSSRS